MRAPSTRSTLPCSYQSPSTMRLPGWPSGRVSGGAPGGACGHGSAAVAPLRSHHAQHFRRRHVHARCRWSPRCARLTFRHAAPRGEGAARRQRLGEELRLPGWIAQLPPHLLVTVSPRHNVPPCSSRGSPSPASSMIGAIGQQMPRRRGEGRADEEVAVAVEGPRPPLPDPWSRSAVCNCAARSPLSSSSPIQLSNRSPRMYSASPAPRRAGRPSNNAVMRPRRVEVQVGGNSVVIARKRHRSAAPRRHRPGQAAR